MKKIICLVLVSLLIISCDPLDYTVPPFNTQVPFSQSYPDVLTLSDGSLVKQVPGLYLLNFDSIPNHSLIAVDLKLIDFELVIDSPKVINNSPKMLWVRSSMPGDPQTDMTNLKAKFPRINWLTTGYYSGPVVDSKKFFAPLPRTLLIKSELVNNSLKDRFLSIGLKPTNNEVAGYSIYNLSNNTLSVFAISQYLRRLAPFQNKESFYFENLPYYRPTLSVPNDTFWPQQQPAFDLIDVPDAWDLAGTNSVKVSVIDCGFNVNYTDIQFESPGMRMDNLALSALPHYMADRNHGTAVISLVGAIRNNAAGIAGVSSATILPLALAANTDVEVALALDLSVSNSVHIVNMSVGDYSWQVSVLDPALESAHNTGLLLIAAAGTDSLSELPMPANHVRVMTVGGSYGAAHYPSSNYAQFVTGSNWKGISVVAPCVRVASVDFNGNLWSGFGGTSAACPLVTGVAALLKATSPALTSGEIQVIIEQSAEKISGPYVTHPGFSSGDHNETLGYGRVNAKSALESLMTARSMDIEHKFPNPYDPEPPIYLPWWLVFVLLPFLTLVVLILLVRVVKKKKKVKAK